MKRIDRREELTIIVFKKQIRKDTEETHTYDIETGLE